MTISEANLPTVPISIQRGDNYSSFWRIRQLDGSFYVPTSNDFVIVGIKRNTTASDYLIKKVYSRQDFTDNGFYFSLSADETKNFIPSIYEYDIAILKREEEKCHRIYYHLNAKEGIAHFISTYDHNGDPLPSFSSNPIRLKIEENAKDFAEKLWASLNNDNKISLYVCHGQKEYIFNKNEGD